MIGAGLPAAPQLCNSPGNPLAAQTITSCGSTARLTAPSTCASLSSVAFAGAVACVYAFCVTMFVYRDYKWRELPLLVHRTMRTVAMVLTLIAFAASVGYMRALSAEGLLSLRPSAILAIYGSGPPAALTS